LSDDQPLFKNDRASVTVTHKPECYVVAVVEITPAVVKQAYDEAVKSINKEVSVPGFRKGKAPKDFIIQSFAKQIDKEWNDIAANAGFKEAVILSGLHPLKDAQIKTNKVKLSVEDGGTFSYEYEIFPIVPDVNPEELQLPTIPLAEVTEKEIDTVVEQLRFQKVEWEQVTDRPVQEGDFVDMDIEAVMEPPQVVSKNQRHAVVTDKMDEWIFRPMIGRAVGETFEATSEQSKKEKTKTEEEEEAEFIPQCYRFVIHAIYTAKLPEFDDAFALNYGATNRADLEVKIAKTLRQQSINELRNNYRSNLQELLADKYVFDVPKSLLKKQIQLCVQNLAQQIYNNNPNISEAELKNQVNASAEQTETWAKAILRMEFLLQHVAKNYNVHVTEKEVNDEWAYLTQMAMLTQKSEKEFNKNKIAHDIFTTKVLDTLLSKIKLNIDE